MCASRILAAFAAAVLCLTVAGCDAFSASPRIPDKVQRVQAWGNYPFATRATAKTEERAKKAALLLGIAKADRPAFVKEMMRETSRVTLCKGSYLSTYRKDGRDGAEHVRYVGKCFLAEEHHFLGKMYYIVWGDDLCWNYITPESVAPPPAFPPDKPGQKFRTPTPLQPDCVRSGVWVPNVPDAGVVINVVTRAGPWQAGCPAVRQNNGSWLAMILDCAHDCQENVPAIAAKIGDPDAPLYKSGKWTITPTGSGKEYVYVEFQFPRSVQATIDPTGIGICVEYVDPTTGELVQSPFSAIITPQDWRGRSHIEISQKVLWG